MNLLYKCSGGGGGGGGPNPPPPPPPRPTGWVTLINDDSMIKVNYSLFRKRAEDLSDEIIHFVFPFSSLRLPGHWKVLQLPRPPRRLQEDADCKREVQKELRFVLQ